MAGFFGRIMNLVRGATESFLKDLEADNPDAVYQAAIDAQSGRLREVQESINALVARRDKLQAEKSRLQGEVTSLSEQAAGLASSDEARALQLLEQKQNGADRLTELGYELAGIETQIEETKKIVPEVRAAIEKLKAERDEMVARAHTARGQAARNAVADWQASSHDASESALGRVRESIERQEALDRELGKESAAAPKVSAKEAARQKALTELEAIKKAGAAAEKRSEAARTAPPAAPGTYEEEGEPEEEAPEETVPLSGEEPAPLPGVPRRTL